jgi:hypothetical protein
MARNQINWVRLTAEGAAVVVSILLAFAIDAAWDQFREAEEEQRILVGLEREFEGYVARFDFNVRSGERGLRLLEAALNAGPPTYGDSPPVPVADSALFVLLSAATSDQSGNLAALLSSGRLELLQDDGLRDQLASWPAVMSDIRDNELSNRDWKNNIVSPFLIAHGVPVGRSYAALRAEWPGPLLPDEEAGRLYGELLRRPDFSALVSVAYQRQRNHVNESREAATEARAVLQSIRSSLNAR